MTPDLFLEAFAQAIIARSLDRAESMLAPWVRDGLAAGGLRRVVRVAQGDALVPVAYGVIDLGFDEATDLRDAVDEDDEPPTQPVPSELTSENFRGCFSVEFLPDEDTEADVDYTYAFFVAVVEVETGFAVGYLEPVA